MPSIPGPNVFSLLSRRFSAVAIFTIDILKPTEESKQHSENPRAAVLIGGASGAGRPKEI